MSARSFALALRLTFPAVIIQVELHDLLLDAITRTRQDRCVCGFDKALRSTFRSAIHRKTGDEDVDRNVILHGSASGLEQVQVGVDIDCVAKLEIRLGSTGHDTAV